MNKQTRTALEGSIAKWEAIVAGTGTDEGIENCPLCKVFYFERDATGELCAGCPVKEETGQAGCEGSPYDEWRDIFDEDDGDIKRLAQAELDFLRSLLPPKPTPCPIAVEGATP